MILLFPVPAWVTSRMDGVQKEKMRAVSPAYDSNDDNYAHNWLLQTDARVQQVTEGESSEESHQNCF